MIGALSTIWIHVLYGDDKEIHLRSALLSWTAALIEMHLEKELMPLDWVQNSSGFTPDIVKHAVRSSAGTNRSILIKVAWNTLIEELVQYSVFKNKYLPLHTEMDEAY